MSHANGLEEAKSQGFGARVMTPSNKASRLNATNLKTLQSNGSLHEADIFNICVKTLQPSQMAHILPPSVIKGQDGKCIEPAEASLQALKVFHKVWSSYTKGLFKQVVVKNQIVHCPLFGTWVLASSVKNPQWNPTEDVISVCYMPSSQWTGPL